MEKLRSYDITFSSLKPGVHGFEMVIEQTFFDLFKFLQEFINPKIEVNIELTKHSSFMELTIRTEGEVILECDISNEKYSQHIENSIKTLVKFGEEYDDTNEEVLVIPLGSHDLNVAQLIFESVILSIPMKHIHTRYENGYQDEYVHLLEKYNLPEKEEE